VKFKVKSSITADREYLPGDVIELSPEQAAAMPWAVEAMPVEKAPEKLPEAPKEKGKKG
jgi:hypothetical protein